MSVGRQANILGQQRIDVPHLRSIESATAYDFDVLAGNMLAGGRAFVLSGFELISVQVGTAATSLQLIVANSSIIHPEASESGSIFLVPSTRAIETLNSANSRVQGGFTANAINYIGLDLRRTADATTTDVVQFLNTATGKETPKTVPLARTLDYVIVISAQDFSNTPNVAPLANVTTDSLNNITVLEDARDFMFRLGTGGAITDPTASYAWPNGRTEVGDNSDFEAADKGIASLKDWLDAAMTRMWELGGGEHWYSSTADRNVRMTRAGATFTNGEWFEWDGTDLHWKGLKFVFENSTAYYNDVANVTTNVAGQTDLADGDCVYVDVDRATNRTAGTALVAVKTPYVTLGSPLIPGSRYIIAWRVGANVYTRDSSFMVGTTFTVATPSALGIVKLSHTATTPSTPIVLSDGARDAVDGVVALDSNLRATIAGFGGGNSLTVIGSTTGPGIYTQGGGTSGAGLIAVGGAPQGPAIITNEPLITNLKPQVIVRDTQGHMRGGFDHNGFLYPGNSRWHKLWDVLSTVNNTTSGQTDLPGHPGWQYYLDGAGAFCDTFNFAMDDTGYYMILQLRSPTATGRSTLIFTNTPIAVTQDAQPTGLKWRYDFPLACQIITGVSQGGGLIDTSSTDLPNATDRAIYFRKESFDTNWIAVVNDGGTEVVQIDTGVPPVATKFQLFTIEYYGKNTAYGTATLKYYIDGALVATTTTLPGSGSAMRPAFYCTNISAQGSLIIGDQTLQYNNRLASIEL